MYKYPVILKRDDNDTVAVSFPDFPEAHTFGEDRSEAVQRAVDCLETVLMQYMEDRRDIPPPSRFNKRRPVVTLPALSAAKVSLYQAMRDGGVRKADLAR